MLCGFFQARSSGPLVLLQVCITHLLQCHKCSFQFAYLCKHAVSVFSCQGELTDCCVILNEGRQFSGEFETHVMLETSPCYTNTGEIHFPLPGNGVVAYIAELHCCFPFQFNLFKSLTGQSLLASLENFLTYSCCLTGLVLAPVGYLGT